MPDLTPTTAVTVMNANVHNSRNLARLMATGLGAEARFFIASVNDRLAPIATAPPTGVRMTVSDDVRHRLNEIIAMLSGPARSGGTLDADQVASDVRICIHKLENVLSLLGHTP